MVRRPLSGAKRLLVVGNSNTLNIEAQKVGHFLLQLRRDILPLSVRQHFLLNMTTVLLMPGCFGKPILCKQDVVKHIDNCVSIQIAGLVSFGAQPTFFPIVEVEKIDCSIVSQVSTITAANGQKMMAAVLDRLTHHCHIFEMNGESYRFKQSVQKGKTKKK